MDTAVFDFSISLPLTNSPLFKNNLHAQDIDAFKHIELTYLRARAIARSYDLTPEDIIFLTPKFRQMHQDQIGAYDGGAITLLTIQYNLAAGTLAPYALERPELMPLLTKIMKFDINAQFLLTELAHGLDAPNLETTAVLQPDGSFVLNTPHPDAAKYMPPTGPLGGMAKVAIVIARLIVQGEDRGVRPFVVTLGNGREMAKGISTKLLPPRAGSRPIDHALTYFDHVPLPPTALLGKLDRPRDMRKNFLSVIWRVGVGSIALSTLAIPAIKVSAYVAGKYSLRRTVTGPDGKPLSIISFRTQQLPILHALSQSKVLEAYAKEAAAWFTQPGLSSLARLGVATTLKAIMVHSTQSCLYALAERCGAQGLYQYNQIIEYQLELRGASIAEGDTLVTCIRLASELLLGRYELPVTNDPNSLLARHEAGLFDECYSLLKLDGSNHRSEEFNYLLLPRCLPLIEAIGHRMAYDAAVKNNVDPDLIALYEAGVVKLDSSWYIEHAGLNRNIQSSMEGRAATALLPKIENLIEETDSAPYVSAPIISHDNFTSFLHSLPTFTGSAAQMSITDSDPYGIYSTKTRL